MSYPKEGLAVVVAVLFVSGFLTCCTGCNPAYEDYDTCFNIFLERDFPLVEAFLFQERQRRGIVLVEPEDLISICSGFVELLDCYVYHYINCYAFPGRDYMSRLLRSMSTTHDLLCTTNLTLLQDLFRYGRCIESTRTTPGLCPIDNFDYPMVWKRMFRFQSTAKDCRDLISHTKCLVGILEERACRPEAALAYNISVNNWLSVFCRSSGIVLPSVLSYLAIAIIVQTMFFQYL